MGWRLDAFCVQPAWIHSFIYITNICCVPKIYQTHKWNRWVGETGYFLPQQCQNLKLNIRQRCSLKFLLGNWCQHVAVLSSYPSSYIVILYHKLFSHLVPTHSLVFWCCEELMNGAVKENSYLSYLSPPMVRLGEVPGFLWRGFVVVEFQVVIRPCNELKQQGW